ncbi:phosphoesterase, partial [bacterium]
MNDRESFERFLEESDLTRPVVLHDGDVDGLGAAVVVGDRLPSGTVFLTPPKGENAFTKSIAERLRGLDPSVLFVLDLGIRNVDLLPGVPALFMDHHRPVGMPPGTVLSGYGREPVPTTSLLAWHAAGTPENAWKAAIGNVGDLGPPDPELDAARKGQTIKRFDAAKSLLNSAKRSRDPDTAVPAALRLLQKADSARAVIEADDEDAQLLRAFHE